MNIIIEKSIALMFSLLILGQAYLARRAVGTWVSPGCIFGLFWFGYTFIPLVVLFWVPVYPYAVGFIFLCTAAFSLGSVAFDWKTAFRKDIENRETAPRTYGSRFLKVVFYASALSSLVFMVLNSFVQGFSLQDLFFDLYASAAAYAGMRYSESLTANLSGQLSIITAYLGAILGGLLFSCVPRKGEKARIVVLSFLPSVFVAVTQSSKGLLFLCVVFFYAGLLVFRISVGKLHLFEKRSVKWLALCSAALIVIVTVSFLSGGMYKLEGDALADRLTLYFASYSFGQTYAFSDWFAFRVGRHSEIVTYDREGTSYGFYTFAPVFRLLGSHKVVPPGIFEDYYSYEDVLTTNIYTLFRGLILDFGFIGSLCFMLLAGFLLHWAFHSMVSNRRPAFTVAVFILMVGYSYTSFGISLLIWNNIYVTFALVWTVLQVNQLVARTEGPRQAASGVPVSGPAPTVAVHS